jgi:hypothetical protein
VTTSNQFKSLVRPGVDDVLARPLTPTRLFKSEDLPTLDRPAKANSGAASAGKSAGVAAEVTKVAERARMVGAREARWAYYQGQP